MTTLILPTPSRFDVLEGEPHRLATLEDATVGVFNNGWSCMDDLSRLLEEELRARGAADVVHVRTPHSMPMPQAELGRIAADLAGAVTGLGN